MKKIFSLLILLPFLTGCSFFSVHRMDIEQGNVITATAVSRVHKGMTEEEVKQILGKPILVNLFGKDHLSYVYTFQAGHQTRHITKIVCFFKQGKLIECRLG